MKNIFILSAILLSGCAVSPSLTFPVKPTVETLNKSNFGKQPTSYESTIKQYVSETLIDPDSAKLSNFTRPLKSWLSDGEMGGKTYIGWLVCVDVNAKNKFGGYTGRKLNSFIFNGEKLVFAQSGVKTNFVGDGWGAPDHYVLECIK